ncbi:peptidoglycan -binding protein [Paracoccus aestuarii]|uniref:Peptidoglycan-binding protein n=1 Tax=Paracoccus aestuarii TaxID=453842 RepID=A0A418ZRW8_9RHOB|nr:peptidoglycan -binding protein [Paracoccus aestuarii]RJK99775.1 peptidoglycan -binding protein [Paracoccus aestuarii]WCR00184.1 peptidoglycan -binding protein [Paracoccus aestuarii]
MRLARGSSAQRFSSTIWPGFVDAMTALLMVLMFVLTIFMVVQSVLREQITDQDQTITSQTVRISRQQQQLDELGQTVSALNRALNAAEARETALARDLQTEAERAAQAQAEARDRAAMITRLTIQMDQREADLDAARSRLTDFEAEVAALLAGRAQDGERIAGLQDEVARAEDRASAAELAVAAARSEIDAQAEEARLAAARREALEALTASLRADLEAGADRLAEAEAARAADAQTAADRLAQAESRLTEAEAARLADAEAAALLRQRLEAADTELTAMTLALEERRREAEEVLTLLAAAEAARDGAIQEADATLTEAERQAALLATAQAELTRQQELSQDGQRRVALLNEQVAQLTAQLGSLQALLDAAGEDQQDAQLRVSELGQQLNAALVRAAEETRRRLALEEEARLRAEAEAQDLTRYRSEFFGRLSQILSGREGVQVVGDRFVFQSEVLFAPGEADLSPAGRDQVAGLARLLTEIASEIPPEIDWIIRVDGHTDSLPLSGLGRYRDNWELSQGRALAVVRHLADDLGFPAARLAPTGFADTRPIAPEDSPESRALNRRIELKLTER